MAWCQTRRSTLSSPVNALANAACTRWRWLCVATWYNAERTRGWRKVIV
jgi:hypothetical protein